MIRAVQLAGGEINNVVRIDDTVRREAGFWTTTIHALLKHLEHVGFNGAPGVLGIDEQGREILSFIEGEVISGPLTPPDYLWTEEILVATAKLLRSLHDATATFVEPEDARWQWEPDRSSTRTVICHNDPAWWNVVFQKHKPRAFIDWDLAAPGPAIDDVAYALWYLVPLRDKPELSFSIKDRVRRARLFCQSYGLPEVENIIQAVRERQAKVIRGVERLITLGSEPYRRLWERGAREDIMEDQRYLRTHANSLSAELMKALEP